MREIKAEVVTAAVRQLCITANKVLPEDLVQCIGCARQAEPNSTAKSILGDLENNLAAAKELDLPICQDTGMAVVFAEIGQDVQTGTLYPYKDPATHAATTAAETTGAKGLHFSSISLMSICFLSFVFEYFYVLTL